MLVTSSAYWLLFIEYGINLDDEGTILYQIFRTYLGEIPYVDFHIGYTPGIYYLNAAVMRAFGPSVLPLRAVLAAVNILALLFLFLLGRRIASGSAAAVAVLLYAAFVPVHRAEFCSFNIPYPGWYVNASWLAAALGMLRYAESRRQHWLLAAGALTGASFFFKPNAGLFQLACVVIFLLMAENPQAPPSSGRIGWRRCHSLGWWLLLASVTSGLVFVFAQAAGAREIRLFLGPVLALLAITGLWVVRDWAMGASREKCRSQHLALSTLSLALGFLAVTLPWLGYLTYRMGRERVLLEVFLIGARFEDFYFSFHRALEMRDALLAAAAAGAAAAGWAIRRGLIRPWLPMAGLICAAAALAGAVARGALMPEGLHAAVVSRLEDLSFGMVQIVHWSAIAAVSVAAYRGDLMANPRRRAFALLTATATLMYLLAYPRTDYMHLITAAPATVALGVVLIYRVAEMWAAPWSGARAQAVKALFLAPLVGIAMVRITPSLEGVLEIGEQGAIRLRPQTDLGFARAPVHLEGGRSRRFQELRAVVTYLQSVTEPNELVFTFPALDLVTFLASRGNPTRHGYFFPGWPGHDVEAEVVSDLAVKKPSFVVTLDRPTLFFFHAPAYYYILNDFLKANYVVDREFGAYVVLRRRDRPRLRPDAHWEPAPWVDELPLAVREKLARELSSSDEATLRRALERLDGFAIEEAYPPLLDQLESPYPAVRDLAVWALRRTRSAQAAAALARGVAEGRFSESRTLLALRVVEAVGDLRAAPPLVKFLKNARGRELDGALNGLAAVASKWHVGRSWFGSDRSVPADMREILDPELTQRALKWLVDPWQDWRLRYFGAVVAAGAPLVHSQAALLVGLGSGNSAIMEASAWGLLEAGFDGIPVTPLLPLLNPRDPGAAGLVLKLVRGGAASVRRDLLEALEAAEFFPKEQLAWLAGAIAYPEFEPALLQMAIDDEEAVRLAAAWALGRYRDRKAQIALGALARDERFRVREMARRSLAGRE